MIQEEAKSQSQILLSEDLRKSYGARPALRGLSFSLQAGHILGFLGPNGAGKTTAIRILTTILEPDSGRFVVDGVSSDQPENIRRRIGVLPESLGFPKQMTAVEYLTYFGRLYGLGTAEARAKSLALLEEMGLQHRARSLIGSYSRGMRQRLGIARALVHHPAVVFLDEPTLGLDPRGQQELLGVVRRVARDHNAGVILCSHLLAEVESVCDDVVILNSGRIVAQGTVAEVIGGTQRNVLRIRVPTPSVAHAQQVLQAMPNIAHVTLTGATADWLRVELADGNGTAGGMDAHIKTRVLGALIRAEIPIASFEANSGRLQEVFLQLTEETIQ